MGGRCSRCKIALPQIQEPIRISAEELERLAQKTRVPLLAVVTRRTCGASNSIMSQLGAIAERFSGKAVICVIDADENPALLPQLGFEATPSFALAKSGQLVHRHEGWCDPQELPRWLRAVTRGPSGVTAPAEIAA